MTPFATVKPPSPEVISPPRPPPTNAPSSLIRRHTLQRFSQATSYVTMNQMDKVGEWFAKAIVIDPNQEIPYGYWGDALLKEGKMAKAEAKLSQPENVVRGACPSLSCHSSRSEAHEINRRYHPPKRG